MAYIHGRMRRRIVATLAVIASGGQPYTATAEVTPHGWLAVGLRGVGAQGGRPLIGRATCGAGDDWRIVAGTLACRHLGEAALAFVCDGDPWAGLTPPARSPILRYWHPILRLVVLGLDNRTIAAHLGYARCTVGEVTHLAYRKAGLVGGEPGARAALAAWYERQIREEGGAWAG